MASDKARLYRLLSEAKQDLNDVRRLAITVADVPHLDHQVRDYTQRLELEVDYLRQKIENLREA